MAEALDELADTLPPPVASDVGRDDAAVAEPAEAPAEADAPAAPDDSTSRGDEDPLDRLLSEWDERNGAGNGAATSDDDIVRLLDEPNRDAAAQQRHDQEWQAFQQQTADQQARSAMEIAQRDHQVAELQQTVGQLQNVIAQEVARQHQQQSREDAEKLFAREQEKLSDVAGIDTDHVKRWMLSEAAQDPQLQAAWEARYYQPPGPLDRARIAADIQQWGEGQAKLALQLPARARQEAERNIHAEMRRMWETAFPDPATYRANAAKYVTQALDRMHREARRPRIDADATQDRMLVAQAVRGASGKPPPEPPPDFARMSDRELAKYSAQFGFRAI